MKKNAFTIIELLIYMGILSILLYVLSDIFLSSLTVKSQSETQASLQQDGRYLISKISYDINRASAINLPALGENSNRLEIVIDGQSYIYSLNNGNLQLTNSYGTNNLNSYLTEVSNLNFFHLGNLPTDEKPNPKNTVKISFDLTSKIITNNKKETISFQTTVGIR